jgi:regulator of protease activity HflC (stomatin/prohibitin superfamily)
MNARRSISFITLFLWLESIGLAVAAFFLPDGNLLPAAAVIFLLASLHAGCPIPGLVVGSAMIGTVLSRVISTSFAENVPVTYAVISLVLGVLCAFLGILSNLKSDQDSPARKCLVQLAIFLHFPVAGLYMADPFTEFSTRQFVAWMLAGVFALVAADTLSKFVVRLYTPKRHWHTLPAYGAFFFYRYLGPKFRAIFSPTVANQESLKLAEMWMWPSVRKSLPALIATGLLLTWLGTAVHEVDSRHLGVRQTLGSWEKRDLAPGLHLSAPFPFGQIQKVESQRVHQIVLGFRTDPGQPILWERAHYEDEEISLVGGGDDYLAISIPIFYRIARPSDYLRASADAESLLHSLAARIVQRLTASLPASEIMTTAREPLRAEIRSLLQQDLDAVGSGLLIEAVHLRDIHPPVDVAPFFQDVVAAIEDKETSIHIGEDYRNDNLARFAGNAKATITIAESTRDNRLLAAKAESGRFLIRARARQLDPGLHDLREGFAVFDATLGGAKKAIFDDRIKGTMPMHLDLRKVLNPDLVTTAPPVPQTLIPRPSRSREAFDLEIEGFLREDRGEVPAADFTPFDPDNLLKSQQK